ncbi:hypothetical protein ABEB36_009891 [Hypothenemus hampei]|uniref:MARVEL domain-containing protein n=1 Tax=Hypothenemus hampei TaxID=57062 RepID=A0ABD1ELX4_HYPHA
MGTVVYGPGHMRTAIGIFKVCEAILCLIGIILQVIAFSWQPALIQAFYAATSIGIIISLTIFIFSINVKTANALNGFLMFQYVVLVALFIFLLVVSSVLASKYWGNTSKAAAVFGIIASIVYLIDGVFAYRAYTL